MQVFMPILNCPYCFELSKLHKTTNLKRNMLVIKCPHCGATWNYKKSKRVLRIVCKINPPSYSFVDKLFPRIFVGIVYPDKFKLMSTKVSYNSIHNVYKIVHVSLSGMYYYVCIGSKNIIGFVSDNPLHDNKIFEKFLELKGIETIFDKVKLNPGYYHLQE